MSALGYPLDLTNCAESVRTRFWDKVALGTADECWTWLAFKTELGYGRFTIAGCSPRVLKAPRVAYALSVGPIPAGLTVDHRCRNPRCVNPSHLLLVTHQQNMAFRLLDHTHCRKGHELTEANVRWYAGRRRCRQCHRDHEREYKRQRRKATA